jgi:hypothetical protein
MVWNQSKLLCRRNCTECNYRNRDIAGNILRKNKTFGYHNSFNLLFWNKKEPYVPEYCQNLFENFNSWFWHAFCLREKVLLNVFKTHRYKILLSLNTEIVKFQILAATGMKMAISIFVSKFQKSEHMPDYADRDNNTFSCSRENILKKPKSALCYLLSRSNIKDSDNPCYWHDTLILTELRYLTPAQWCLLSISATNAKVDCSFSLEFLAFSRQLVGKVSLVLSRHSYFPGLPTCPS